MDEKPKRRWFRFRLSTVLILTAILAWGMALHPWATTHYELRTQPFPFGGGIGLSIEWTNAPFDPRFDPSFESQTVHADHYIVFADFTRTATSGQHSLWLYFGPLALVYPALALTAFLAWKAAWAVVERRRNRRATPC